MAKEKFYTSERNVQIVLSLLKANGIRKLRKECNLLEMSVG